MIDKQHNIAAIQRSPIVRTQEQIALTPKDILTMLRRHVWLIIIMTIVGFIIGCTTWFLLKRFSPKYTAETLIEVLPPGRVDPMILTSPLPNKDIAYQFRFSKATLIKQQSTLGQLLRRDAIRNTNWYKSFDSLAKRIEELNNEFRAVPERDSHYIHVSMTCASKKEAALIVNEMIKLFIRMQRTSSEGEIGQKLTELRNQEATIQKQLDQAQRALNDIREVSGFSNLSSGDNFRHTITIKLNELELEQSRYLAEINEVAASVANLERRAQGEIDVVVKNQIETDPININLTQTITSLESELARKLIKMGENHPEIKETRESLRQTTEERELRRAQIAEQTRQSNLSNAKDLLAIMQSRLEELEKQRQAAEAKQKDLDIHRSLYGSRASIRDERKNMLMSIRGQVEKLNMILNDPEAPKVRSMGNAPEPLEISSPKWKIYFPAGAILGLMSGIVLAFLVELLNELVRTPRDVVRHLNMPLLGMICHQKDDELAQDADLLHVVRQAPYSMMSECYRQLRTNLKLSGNSDLQKVLLVTSGNAGEGKSSVAVNIAATFIAEDKKVLFIDTNFRRPVSVTLFPKTDNDGSVEENSELGLSNFLTDQCGYSDVVRPSGINGLDIIDPGILPPNPAELLGSDKMTELIHQSRNDYDYVLIDGPPVLLVSEARVLATQVEATVLVLNATLTKRGTAKRTIRELRGAKANIIGCVLVATRTLKGGYFHEILKSYQDYQKTQLVHSV